MKIASSIAGGWYWCDRCRVNHVECSPCPRDPNYVPPDEEAMKRRLDEAVDHIRRSEMQALRSYIPRIEIHEDHQQTP